MEYEFKPPSESTPLTVTVELDHREHTVEIARGETIFSAVHRAGLCPPFSCQATPGGDGCRLRFGDHPRLE
jgi:hypothetical protein